jgi:hypothetical protein
VYFLPQTTQFFLNPISFFDAVTAAILDDFATYEKSATTHYSLPWLYDPSAAVSNTVPTINVISGRLGSETPDHAVMLRQITSENSAGLPVQPKRLPLQAL